MKNHTDLINTRLPSATIILCAPRILATVLFGMLLVGCTPSSQDASPPSSDEPVTAQDEPSTDDTQSVTENDTNSNQTESAATPENDNATGGNTKNVTTPSPTEQQTVSVVFEDIELLMQEDMVFRPIMLTDRVRELEGKRIRINGYMLPDTKTRGIREFVLLKNTECKFGQGGRADHLMNVVLKDGVTTKIRDQPIAVEGTLLIKPFQGPDGNTWSIYDLDCDVVELYRPRG